MFTQSSPLLTKQSIEVTSNGEAVILRIGNVDLPMHFEHAFDISRWIREEGTACKRGTGRARTTRSLGIASNAEEKQTPLPYTPGVAIHTPVIKRHWHRRDVYAVGRIVHFTIGNSTATLHFESALKIAQWIRVRAKEAQRTAGDVRHWSTFTSSEDHE